jgi:hypothetical protein
MLQWIQGEGEWTYGQDGAFDTKLTCVVSLTIIEQF